MSDSSSAEEALPAPGSIQPRFATPKSERALVRAAKGGSLAALDALVARHWDGAHRAAFLIVQDAGIAEDIAQEAIVATIGALDRFDWRRPLRPYLHRIVVNRSLNWLRARDSRQELSLEVIAPPTVESQAGPGDVRLPGPLIAAMGQLEPTDRAALVLRHVLDYRSREIAEILELDASTLRSRLSRALERLRTALEGGTTDEL